MSFVLIGTPETAFSPRINIEYAAAIKWRGRAMRRSRWSYRVSGQQTDFCLIPKFDLVGRIIRVSEITLFTASRGIPLNHYRALRASRLILPIAESRCIDRPPANPQFGSNLASESPTAIGANSHAFVVTYLRNRYHIFSCTMPCSARGLEGGLCRSIHGG